MDKNRPLPFGTALDDYREKDYERRKRVGYKALLYPSAMYICDANSGYVNGTTEFNKEIKSFKLKIEDAHSKVLNDMEKDGNIIMEPYSYRLNNATDLRTLPDLEARIMKKFEDLRQDLVNCDITSFIQKDAERGQYVMERLYKSNHNDIKDEIYKLKTSFIPNHPDKKVFPIEDYELAIYKDGKIAHLRHFHYKNSVLKVQDFEPDLDPEPFSSDFSVLLYLPDGASELQIY